MQQIKKIAKFLREVKSEFRKVVWPSREKLINMTTVVVSVAVLVGLFLTGMDYIFQQLMQLII